MTSYTYTRLVRYNRTIKSPAVKSRSKRREREKRGMEEEQYGRTKNTPSPPGGITFQLQLHRGFRMGRTCAPPGYINLGKASSCARMRDPRGASGYLESPIVTVYFAADVEAHFSLFFFSFSFFLRSYLSYSLSLSFALSLFLFLFLP